MQSKSIPDVARLVVIVLGGLVPVDHQIEQLKYTIMHNISGLQIRLHTRKLFFLFSTKTCCGYSKEPSR